MSGFEIREARPEEYVELGELTARAYLALGADGAPGGYDDELRDVTSRAAVCPVLVAVDAAGTVLGGATYVPDRGNPMCEHDVVRHSIRSRRERLLDEADKGAGFRTDQTPGGKHRPQVDRRQCPVGQHAHDLATRQFRAKHPFGGDRQPQVGHHRRTDTLGRRQPDAWRQHHGDLDAVAP